MRIKEAFSDAINILTRAGADSAKIDALVLLCHVLKCDKAYLHTHPDDILPEQSVTLLFELVQKRANSTPLQYLTGFQEFMSLPFAVTKNVLIPRQDTEVLVETALALCAARGQASPPMSILDIGTGSGCIAISLARYLANANITAVDVSEKALEIAAKNAELNLVTDMITFLQSNLFENLSDRKFDLIVSNPPYIPTSDIDGLMPDVRLFEPHLALDGGKSGLEFYEAIISKAPEHLNSEGYLILEAGIDQANDIARLMKKCFCNIDIIKDLSGIERVVSSQLLIPNL